MHICDNIYRGPGIHARDQHGVGGGGPGSHARDLQLAEVSVEERDMFDWHDSNLLNKEVEQKNFKKPEKFD
jgi:hypothetical protein